MVKAGWGNALPVSGGRKVRAFYSRRPVNSRTPVKKSGDGKRHRKDTAGFLYKIPGKGEKAV